MTLLDLDDAEQPMDPMLAMAIQAAFRRVSLTPVQFVTVPRAWCKKRRTQKSMKGPDGPRKGRMKMALAKKDGARCAYCAREFVDLDDATLDHVIPNRVVAHWQTWNLVLSCTACNNAKADRVPLVLMPIIFALLRQTAPLLQDFKREQQALKRQQEQEQRDRRTVRAARRAAHEARASRNRIRKQIQALSGVPVRLAIEAAPVRAALPAGGQ